MAALAKRIFTVLLTAGLAFAMVVPAASAGSYESEALTLLNQARAAAGLNPVAMNANLSDNALAWTQHMEGQQQLSHNPNLSAVTGNWDKLGENVGVGTSIASLHEAFMQSPGHRGNILGDYDSVGIAVVAETQSKLWITVVFMKTLGAAPAGGEDPEPYAELQPVVSTGQPAANEATDPTPPAPHVTAPATPAAAIVVRWVRTFQPRAI
ncbi:MAG: CAP domain-containing protein [Acidimicrobiia bacterium]